jgi:hypothetical protein
MSRRPVRHPSAEQTTPSTSARALLFDIDVDRHKRIDRYIDYFGSGARRTTVVPSAAVWRRSTRRSSNGREEDTA